MGLGQVLDGKRTKDYTPAMIVTLIKEISCEK
ncbi:hypothetical protein KYG_16677 [Acidovorax sp. NO-1]|nr:hypothetical protein KYG_16677 [Acidovorax sp. NO-1]